MPVNCYANITNKIPDVWVIEPDLLGDDRGFFMETFMKAISANEE